MLTLRIKTVITAMGFLLVAAACQSDGDGSKTPVAKADTEKSIPVKTDSAVQQSSAASIKAIDEFIAQQAIDKKSAGWKTSLPKPPQVAFNEGKKYFWNLKTNKGDISIQLMPEIAPMHVSSTIYLTRLGFYDNVVFHRVITRFMAQGGDPTGTGRAGPGYKYEGEFSPSVKHNKPGLLSMANAGPGTDGSQFFLTFVETPWLDGKHTIFGEIVSGMDTMRVMESLGSRSGKTSEKLELLQATIEVK